jgi:hypothetical protein
VYALAVYPRRTTLKSGCLHFAGEGAIIIIIIIINGVVGGRLGCCTCRWYDWLPMSSVHVYLLTMALYCLIVCMYGVQGIYGAQGVHIGESWR